MAVSFTPRQDAFRFYNDDGSESASTAAAVQSTNISITDGAGNVSYHLRVGIQETGGGSATNNPWKLQYSKNGGAYADVTTTSSNVKAINSANLTDGGSTTQRLTGLTGTFDGGLVSETGTTGSFVLSANRNAEFLFAIQTVDADLAATDTIDFRVLYNGATLAGGYVATPRITNAAGGTTYNETLGASLTASVNFAATATITASVAESATASFSSIGGLLLSSAITESATAGFSAIIGAVVSKSIAETLTATESMAVTVVAQPLLIEAVTASSGMSVIGTIATSIAESLTATDNMAGALSYSLTIAESITASASYSLFMIDGHPSSLTLARTALSSISITITPAPSGVPLD